MPRRPPRTAGPLAALGIRAGLPFAADRARVLACSRTHLLHCERGAVLPGLDLMARMATAYGVTFETVERAAEACVRRLERRSA